MDPVSNKDSKVAKLKSDWVEDAVNLQAKPLLQQKRLAVGITIVSCVLYSVLYSLVAQYREHIADHVRELSIFARIVLNIYQPFLIVFMIISVSMLILLYLRLKKPWLNHKWLLAMMVFNSLFAATLLAVSVLKVI